MASKSSARILIAASGTGGHIFPALAVAEQLTDYQIEWLGVPDRLEQQLVRDRYSLNTISVGGFQQGMSLKSLKTLFGLVGSIFRVRQLLQQKNIQVVFTTGGYIAAPAIIAAKLQGIPVILHESNFLPGKVTRWFSRWCHTVAIGFPGTEQYLKDANTRYVSTPVRSQFYSPQTLDLPIAPDSPVIAIVGGSQGAVAVNQLIRKCAPTWVKLGATIVHLTGERDPDALSWQHPQYLVMPFYDRMAALLQRTDLVIARAGASTLTELAVTRTPSILIPYPYAAEDHQAFNGRVFVDGGAALMYRQEDLAVSVLEQKVADLLNSPEELALMGERAGELALMDSAKRIADLIVELIKV